MIKFSNIILYSMIKQTTIYFNQLDKTDFLKSFYIHQSIQLATFVALVKIIIILFKVKLIYNICSYIIFIYIDITSYYTFTILLYSEIISFSLNLYLNFINHYLFKFTIRFIIIKLISEDFRSSEVNFYSLLFCLILSQKKKRITQFYLLKKFSAKYYLIKYYIIIDIIL